MKLLFKQRFFSWFDSYDIYDESGNTVYTFFKPKFTIDFNGWYVEGDFFGWDYNVYDRSGRCVAGVSKQLFNWTDTYVIDVAEPKDALGALMLALAIDAEKCSNND